MNADFVVVVKTKAEFFGEQNDVVGRWEGLEFNVASFESKEEAGRLAQLLDTLFSTDASAPAAEIPLGYFHPVRCCQFLADDGYLCAAWSDEIYFTLAEFEQPTDAEVAAQLLTALLAVHSPAIPVG